MPGFQSFSRFLCIILYPPNLPTAAYGLKDMVPERTLNMIDMIFCKERCRLLSD